MFRPADLLAAAWGELRGELADGVLGFLTGTGLDCPRTLGSLDDLSHEALQEYLDQLATQVGVPGPDEGAMAAIEELIARTGRLRAHGIRRSAAVPVEVRTAGGLLLEREAKRRATSAAEQRHSTWLPPPAPKGGRWPTRTSRARAEGVGLEEADKKARQKYVDMLVAELKSLKLPVVYQAGHSQAGEDRLGYLAGGRRTGTLRRRLGDWARLRKWLEVQDRATGFPEVRDLLDYLEARAAEPCGKTVLQSAVEAVNFLETVGSVPAELRISHATLVVAAVEELSSRLGSRRHPDRRQANYLPVELLVAFERAVVCEERPAYTRLYAWLRLIKYWASLRFDDLRWVDASKNTLEEGGMRLYLERTKVTGPGKRVGTLVAFVCRDAYVQEEAWLRTGFELRRTHLVSTHLMFPLPTKDLGGVINIPGEYSDASAASQALFVGLPGPVPSGDLGVVQHGLDSYRAGIHLLPPGAGLFWTEHSERNGVPTAAASLGYSDDIIKRIGRWQVGLVQETYIRSTIEIVTRVQQDIAGHFRRSEEDFLDEASTLKKLTKFMAARGMADKDLELLVERLSHFRSAGRSPSAAARKVRVEGMASAAGGGAGQEPEADDDEEEAPVGNLTGYVVSIVGRKGFRRLHHLAKCGMLPGTDYKEYVWYGEVLPDPALYDSICSRCWRQRAAFEEEAAGAVTGPPSASSSGETATTVPYVESD